MISNQILQNTIDGLKGISKVDFSVLDTEGKELASTLDNAQERNSAVISFVESPADSQVIQGCQFFKIFDEQRLEYVLLAALWEMAEEEKIGFEIAMGSISLKQETVEICEYYRLNPYQLTSAGSYLILTDEADQVIEVLEKAGARAVRLGVAKAQNARVITSKEEIRYLDRPAPDELARWQKDYKKCEK